MYYVASSDLVFEYLKSKKTVYTIILEEKRSKHYINVPNLHRNNLEYVVPYRQHDRPLFHHPTLHSPPLPLKATTLPNASMYFVHSATHSTTTTTSHGGLGPPFPILGEVLNHHW